MARHEQAAPSALLSRWLSTAPRAEAPAAPPVTAGTTSTTAAEVLADLERLLATSLPARQAALVSSLLDPVRAALAAGAVADADALQVVFEKVEDLLEAFLLAPGAESSGTA
jgi:hypothetical protein